MGRRNDHKGQLVNTLFTMLLFLVFVLCALFAVLIGGKVYRISMPGRNRPTAAMWR